MAYEGTVTVQQVGSEELIVDEAAQERITVTLVTDEERTLADGEIDFVKKYERWSMDKLGPAHNGPYARQNAWLILAGAYCDIGRIPHTGDSLNFFSCSLGGSGSGKSSSRRLWKSVMQEVFEHDPAWALGSDASPVALHEKLIERDGKVSLFTADEAHGFFRSVNSQQWADGIYEKMAEYYNGEVPPMLRASQGRRELSGKSAKTFFNVHFMGTLKGELSLPAQLHTSMFYTGFLARFLWFIGDEKPVTDESLKETNGNSEAVISGHEQQARQWAAEFANNKKILKAKTGRSVIALNMTPGALERFSAFKISTRDLAQQRAEWNILEPSLTRLWESARKAASLLALDDGRSEVELRDVVMAIRAAEEWVSNLFTIAAQISASAWAREIDEIEAFLIAKGGQAKGEVVMRKFGSRHLRDLLTQLDSLAAQGRVIEAGDKTGKIYKIVKEN